jgi:23S rRNA (pseudouridine1915-N3)-methyltransferase
MNIYLVAVGKPRNPALVSAIGEYERRAGRYWPLRVLEVREERGSSGAELVREREGERLLSAIPPRARLVDCDERGNSMNSEEFAHWLQAERERASGDLAFVIGGAFGLSAAIRERSVSLLSLAPWTLPHELARLVLAEQLYRAGTLIRGEPYHKA